MTFQRARTDEQRAERRRQILDAAAAMLAEMPVAALSLNELSRRVGLAKANVLRYFESREAVLLELLDAEISVWIDQLGQVPVRLDDPLDTRVATFAELIADSLTGRPVLCDLMAAQGAVLERNISTTLGVQHKQRARAALGEFAHTVTNWLPELDGADAGALVETTLLLTIATWQCSQPTQAMTEVYASDPDLAAMRMDFTKTIRRSVIVTAFGLIAPQLAVLAVRQ